MIRGLDGKKNNIHAWAPKYEKNNKKKGRNVENWLLNILVHHPIQSPSLVH